MRAREHVDGGSGEQRLRVLGALAQSLLRELPAGERFGVAVRDADAQAPDFSDKVHGQDAQALAQVRMPARGLAKPLEDFVRSLDLGFADPIRVAAAATGSRILARDLGLDIAAERRVPQNRFVDRAKSFRIHVEPVEIAVEDERGVFASREIEDRLEREGIAVEPADDVERLRLEVRGPREDRGRVTVVARTGPAGPRSSH